MSWELILLVRDLAPSAIDSTARLVLWNLASHENNNGAFASVATMARETSLSPRAIHQALKRLKRQQFVAPVGHTSRRIVRYQLNQAVLQREAYDPDRRADLPLNHVQTVGGQPVNDVQTIGPRPVNDVRRMRRPPVHDERGLSALGAPSPVNDVQMTSERRADKTSEKQDLETSEKQEHRGCSAISPSHEEDPHGGPSQEQREQLRALRASLLAPIAGVPERRRASARRSK